MPNIEQQFTVDADVDDAIAKMAALGQSVTDVAAPVAQLKIAFTDVGATAAREASRIAAPYRRAFDEIGASWEAAVSGLIDGTTSIRQAGQRALDSVTRSAVSIAGTTLSRAAAGPVASLLGQAAPTASQGVGDVLGGALARFLTGAPQQLGQAAETTASTTTLAANTAALAANTAALSTLTASLSVAATAGGASAAGSLGGVAQIAGGTAQVGAAASGGGGVLGFLGGLFAFAGGGIVPSAAGGWVLPGFAGARPALLHAREMVLPAPLSEGLQRLIAGGGDGGAGSEGSGSSGGDLHLHFHGPSDGPSVERWFSGLMARNPGVVRNMFRSNALTPRNF